MYSLIFIHLCSNVYTKAFTFLTISLNIYFVRLKSREYTHMSTFSTNYYALHIDCTLNFKWISLKFWQIYLYFVLLYCADRGFLSFNTLVHWIFIQTGYSRLFSFFFFSSFTSITYPEKWSKHININIYIIRPSVCKLFMQR